MTNTTTTTRINFSTSLRVTAMLTLACLCNEVVAEDAIKPGDHIAIVGNTFADQLRVHGYFETLLLQRTQGNPVSVRNLGWGGDMLTARDRPTNFPSEESTLSTFKADVIVACFGMGESFAGRAGLDDFRKDLQAFIATHAGKKYNGKSAARLILISPIAYEDHGKRTPNHDQRNRDLKAYTQVMSEVAAAKKIPFVDLYEPTLSLMNKSSEQTLTTNGIHLTQYGYWIVSRVMADALLPADQGWQLEIDASAKAVEAKGVTVAKIEKDDRGWNLTIKEQGFPSLTPPKGAHVHAGLSSQRDVVVFKNLPKGRFTLSVDGQHIATGTNIEWANGLVIDTSPAHDEAEAFRQAVNDKNEHFIYSWKALNQVHIVGERKRSASGRALPGEVIEFNKLADQKDKSLRAPVTFKTRQWLLAPHTK